jgi:hypothetical protein
MNRKRWTKSFKSPIYEAEVQSHKKTRFIKQNATFSLKWALFVEISKNKFAYDYKKNKFVFN